MLSKRNFGDPTTSNNNGNNEYNIGIILLFVFLFIIIIFSIWCTCTDSGKSTFSNIKTKLSNLGSNRSDLKSLDVVMFMSPTCPWCKKMMNVIESSGQMNNIMIVDITKEEGASMAKQFGADKQPIPSFISRKNQTGTVGYRDSIDKLIEALKKPEGIKNTEINSEISSEEVPSGNVDINFIKSLQIILFARDGCPWCVKAKETCSDSGIIDIIQIIDITTPEGQQLAEQLLPPGTSGVPAWVSMATKKHIVGYKPIDQIIQSLQ